MSIGNKRKCDLLPRRFYYYMNYNIFLSFLGMFQYTIILTFLELSSLCPWHVSRNLMDSNIKSVIIHTLWKVKHIVYHLSWLFLTHFIPDIARVVSDAFKNNLVNKEILNTIWVTVPPNVQEFHLNFDMDLIMMHTIP